MRKYLTLIVLLLVAGCGRLVLPTEPTELPPRTIGPCYYQPCIPAPIEP